MSRDEEDIDRDRRRFRFSAVYITQTNGGLLTAAASWNPKLNLDKFYAMGQLGFMPIRTNKAENKLTLNVGALGGFNINEKLFTEVGVGLDLWKGADAALKINTGYNLNPKLQVIGGILYHAAGSLSATQYHAGVGLSF